MAVLHLLSALLALLQALYRALIALISRSPKHPTSVPISVNYHFTRQCNYQCGFCFHTAKTSYVAPIDDAKRGLKLLRDAGMQKLNFAGGEPFLEPKFLGELCRYAKEDLHIPSVSIVSNGSRIKEGWLKTYGKYVDILAVSCDSFVEKTNVKIGRGKGEHLASVRNVAAWCRAAHIKFKINTVVNIHNWEEDMAAEIVRLAPARWKVFQVLIIDGENSGGDDCKRDATPMTISKEQFKAFTERHKRRGISEGTMVAEDNDTMRDSYLILDEYLCFLTGGEKRPSQSILDVGVAEALKGAQFDRRMFEQRDGSYFKRPEFRSNLTDIEDLAKTE